MRLKALEDERGTALVEFALVAPIFLMMVFGIVGYGGYFWRAHALQQIAQDGARAAIPGLTDAERQALALVAINSEIAIYGIPGARMAPPQFPQGDPNTFTVLLSYDGSRDGFLNLSIVPLPSKTIRRIAAVRLGGL